MLTIIKVQADENGQHEIQCQCDRTIVWLEGYIAVPAHLEAKAWESLGWCDLVIDEETGVLTDIIPGEKPEPPEPEPSETELLRQKVAELQNQILTMRLGG